MKKLRIAGLLCILSCCLVMAAATGSRAQGVTEPPVAPVLAQNIVTSQLNELVRLIDVEDLQHYGISDYSDVQHMTTGKVIYQVRFWDRDVISGDYSDNLQHANIMVPINLKGKTVFFAYLTVQEGKMMVDGIGGHNEAQMWQSALESVDDPYAIMLHTPVDHGDYIMNRERGTFENVSLLQADGMPTGNGIFIKDLFEYSVRTAREARSLDAKQALQQEINK